MLIAVAAILGIGWQDPSRESRRAEDLAPAIEFSSVTGGVAFEHEMHYSEFEIACEECHHETAAGELHTPHDEYIETSSIDCGGCHHEGVEASESRSCSHCHHDTPTTIADETLSPKVVIHEVCWRCHDVGRGEAASRRCKDCHRSAE